MLKFHQCIKLSCEHSCASITVLHTFYTMAPKKVGKAKICDTTKTVKLVLKANAKTPAKQAFKQTDVAEELFGSEDDAMMKKPSAASDDDDDGGKFDKYPHMMLHAISIVHARCVFSRFVPEVCNVEKMLERYLGQ